MKAASLSGQLLARKGDARPALTPAREAIGHLVEASPQPFPSQPVPSQPVVSHPVTPQHAKPQPVASEPTAAQPQDRGIASIMRPSLARAGSVQATGDTGSSVTPLRPAMGGGGPGARETVRLSVRMGRDRHRKLRILAAQRGLSLQQAMIQAIDGLVATAAEQPGTHACACLGYPERQPERSKS